MLNGINPKSRTRPKINNLTSFTMDSINYSRNVKSINNFSNHIFENKCLGGKECKNYHIMLQMEFQIKKLHQTIQQLLKINDYFSFNMNQKEKMYKQIMYKEYSKRSLAHP